MITVVIPAHNEASALPATIASLRGQTTPPNGILVVSDNSTDDTVAVARSCGVAVMETIGNTARKAGALNQALGTLTRAGLVLIMDADTELVPTWIDTALRALQDPRVGAAGAVFRGHTPTSYLEVCQYLEWSRYAEEGRRKGKTFVLSGTAALIRWEALEDVRRATGRWYSEDSITEDMEITLALKSAGWELRSPPACSAVTEMMPTVKMLFFQRRRWNLGALQNVSAYWGTPVVRPYVRQQVMLAVSVILLWGLILFTVIALALNGPVPPQPFWLAVGAIFVTERVLTVWDEPIRYRLFAALVLPELTYAVILQSTYLAAVWQKLTGSAGTWQHVTPQKASA
ncbi:glycosyltransferase [Nesterenkonia natronophila]|uniref:Glycosyltransferase family 2 protein n=1 Tax=Nesterenkonia natronophila TaxID=2174932 RepID=A0A3A4FEB0_9MICC|nr:glycosyltransferase family 2 protein [Nesterenkonia natronophila]RJN33144.1 glycosyltransferase family 2 protein [Nesterenkonia natronophila]